LLLGATHDGWDDAYTRAMSDPMLDDDEDDAGDVDLDDPADDLAGDPDDDGMTEPGDDDVFDIEPMDSDDDDSTLIAEDAADAVGE